MKEIIIIGAGGHAKVIIDIILQRKKFFNDKLVVKGILDDIFCEYEEKKIFGIPIIGKIDKILELPNNTYYIIAIGNNSIRKKIFQKYNGREYATLIHPKAVIAEEVTIGEGTVIMAGAIVNSHTRIGKHCILNTGSIVEHDNFIEDYVHISPGAVLCGGISVEEGTWIGANVVITHGMKIGKEVIIGAGAVVIKNIDNKNIVAGNPAKMIKKQYERKLK